MTVKGKIEQKPQDPAVLDVAHMVVAEAMEIVSQLLEVDQPFQEAYATGIASVPLRVAVQLHQEQLIPLKMEVQLLNSAVQPLDKATASSQEEEESQPDEIILAEKESQSENVVLAVAEPQFQEVTELQLQDVVAESRPHKIPKDQTNSVATVPGLQESASKTNKETTTFLVENVPELTPKLKETFLESRNRKESTRATQGQDLAAIASYLIEAHDLASAMIQSGDLGTAATEQGGVPLLQHTVKEAIQVLKRALTTLEYQNRVPKTPASKEYSANHTSPLKHTCRCHEIENLLKEESVATVEILIDPDTLELSSTVKALESGSAVETQGKRGHPSMLISQTLQQLNRMRQI